MQVIYWGTYDRGKPRNRILIKGLKENAIDVVECHKDVWNNVEDKSQIESWRKRLVLLGTWVSSYPYLIYQYLRSPAHDCVIIGYLGHLDILVLWLFAKIKRKPIIFDAFISLYDTVVNDRKLISKSNPLSLALYVFEWLACKAADLVILDTQTHASYFIRQYSLAPSACVSVFVGAEIEKFPKVNKQKIKINKSSEFKILFYGQFIPLHGINTIIEAAYLLKHVPCLNWQIIGSGQEEKKIEEILKEKELPQVNWIKWVNYHDLVSYIHNADVCLGIFGTSEKASRVIPNKVFQIISSGKTLITRDSPAIRELFPRSESGLFLINSGSPQELAKVILTLIDDSNVIENEPHFSDFRDDISPRGIGSRLKNHINQLAKCI